MVKEQVCNESLYWREGVVPLFPFSEPPWVKLAKSRRFSIFWQGSRHWEVSWNLAGDCLTAVLYAE